MNGSTGDNNGTMKESKKTVLIVDDNEKIREEVSAHLTKAGFVCKKVIDGEQAMKLASSANPDLILLDVIMPNMDGITFVKEMREEKKDTKTPIIMFTNLSERETAKYLNPKTVQGHISKANLSMPEMLDKVHKEVKAHLG
ncbi:MAG: hypothetical protein COU08_04670 [Candidatus Harrisonbacteria bacterium CG10_big_fil_rev_8_21_14_0_10_42_17]|uniref:Response regulatory domain-containing protein n=1 Tax=Candidatus Harrisonbacteria bacterium CG10_big_fil_rev_8_21_14_0_10_42_17 TaxID=1974584 RepID=A0A2M6WH98_9BACT|nr:MAG: hypothetical protein COU08_04670 [Candidatus Harrisonbacteria bacterium CG10_big_fil_rev_8_21_14_0_10_42_17]